MELSDIHNFDKPEYDRRVKYYTESREFKKADFCCMIQQQQKRIHGRVLNPNKVLMKDKRVYLIHHLVRLQQAKLRPIRNYDY